MIRILLLAAVNSASAQSDGVDFFEKKIRPVLVEHCYACHSEGKKIRGGLTVDSRDALLKGGESGPAIVPGKAKESLLVKAVHYNDPDLRMPPKKKLDATIIADLEKWVAMGAPDPRVGSTAKTFTTPPSVEEGKKNWAYQVPRKHPIPETSNKTWPKNDIDRFLLAKLEGKGIQPAADADKATLLRRTYFALIGLPPTPAQIDAFLADKSSDAFVTVVDRLLESKQFGERWGRFWLDVARYADSTGGGRSLLFKDSWRYRDYVVDSFNQDKPFDRFILEQIAGDLLAAKSDEERRVLLVATAFLLLGPTNYERQDKPILEMDIIDEQLDTIGKAFLGMTMGCARCHDHKFDPIPTKDYYAMAGILKSTKFIVHDNVSKWNEMALPTSGVEGVAIAKHDALLAALKAEIKSAKVREAKSGVDVTAKGAIDPETLPGIVIDDSQAKKVGPWKHSTFTGNFIGTGYLYDDRGQNKDKTLTFQPDFPKTGVYEVRLAYVPFTNRATNVPVRIFHADGDETVRVNQKLTPPIDGHFVSLGKFRFEKGNQWFVMVSTDGADGHVTVDAVQFLAEDDVEVPKEPKAPPKVKGERSVKELEAELKQLTANGPPRPVAMALREGDKIEPCHICIRGNFHNKGETAPRGMLQVMMPANAEHLKIGPKESGRLQMAKWLASADNPQTARVTVNRVWHHLFGVGLVRTVDNFGKTGELPSHPELLDHLAIRFVEQGWSTKKLIREIVLSHAFQVSGKASPEAEKADPENRLLSHAHRRRLDAESIRDTLLTVSGQLDLAGGGPVLGKSTEREFQFTDTRRSVYTPILRNKLLELFEVFDFADPNVCTGRRNVSTISTQALYFMNSPFIMDQAKASAAKLAKAPGLDDAGRLSLAYRSALGREPMVRERQLLLEYLEATPTAERSAAWERVFQSIFGCIDFRYVE